MAITLTVVWAQLRSRRTLVEAVRVAFIAARADIAETAAPPKPVVPPQPKEISEDE
jgi:hypothetical protein